MMKLRLLIVDDEILARERLRGFLEQEPAVEILGECANGSDALQAIQREQPDLVLLDMQMPGCTGMEVVAALPAERRPAIVFVTAHARYAVDAFGVQAIDYLLKPFDQERLQLALRRASDQLRAKRESDLGARVESLLSDVSARNAPRLTFRSSGRIVFLRPGEIVWVEAANNSVVLHLADGNTLALYETLSALEQRLGPVGFLRINRSALVYADQVKELHTTQHGDHEVMLREGQCLPLSRSLRGSLERLMAIGTSSSFSRHCATGFYATWEWAGGMLSG